VTSFLSEDFVGLRHPPTRHAHGGPADHNADGGASRGQRDPIIGEEGVESAEFAGALCGWGCGVGLVE